MAVLLFACLALPYNFHKLLPHYVLYMLCLLLLPIAWATIVRSNNCTDTFLSSQCVQLEFELRISGFEFDNSTIELAGS